LVVFRFFTDYFCVKIKCNIMMLLANILKNSPRLLFCSILFRKALFSSCAARGFKGNLWNLKAFC
jgi:hypothetical protein